MFGWLKTNPIKKLEKDYQAKLKEAMESQRNGNIRGYAELTAEAEALYQQLESLRQQAQKT